MEEVFHSGAYKRLGDAQKDVADAIISFLDGQNNERAREILHALLNEINYFSVIKASK